MHFSSAAYTALRGAVETGSTRVWRSGYCNASVAGRAPLTTLLSIAKHGGQAKVHKEFIASEGRNVPIAIDLTLAGLRALRSDILARGHEVPAELEQAIADRAPASTRLPVEAVFAGRETPIPF